MPEPRRVGEVLPSVVPGAPKLYQIPKRCTEPGCNRRWVGNSFSPLPAGVDELPYICDDCIARQDERTKELSRGKRPQQQLDLAPPRPTSED